MKKLVLSIIALVGSFSIMTAQHFRVEGGVNFHKFQDMPTMFKQSFQELPIRATLGLELNLTDFLYIETEGTYTKTTSSLVGLGATHGEGIARDFFNAVSTKLKPNGKLSPIFYQTAIKVPVNIGFRFSLSDAFALSLEAGPYATFGIGSEVGYKGTKKANINDMIKSEKIKKEFINKMLFGLNASAALELSMITLRVGAEYDLTNRINFDKSFQENIDSVKPVFEKFNENRLNIYTTVGLRF